MGHEAYRKTKIPFSPALFFLTRVVVVVLFSFAFARCTVQCVHYHHLNVLKMWFLFNEPNKVTEFRSNRASEQAHAHTHTPWYGPNEIRIY